MPQFFPLETVEAFISDGTQGFDLPSDGDISLTRQNIFAVFATPGRVLQVCMPYPRTQLFNGKFRLLVRISKGMVRVPEQAHMIGIGALQYSFEGRGGGKVVMRFYQYG